MTLILWIVGVWFAFGFVLLVLLIAARALARLADAAADRERLRFRAALQERRLDNLMRSRPHRFRTFHRSRF
jgi:uncharacterized membrane protein